MKTILVVDDDQYLTDLLHFALMREGFQTVAANSGGAALHALRTARIDLVLLDVTLPDMDGFMTLAAMRAFTRIPVIMLTARAEDADIVAGFDAGADDYVSKPFSMQVLLMRIQAALRRVGAPLAASAAKERMFDLGEACFFVERHEIASAAGVITLTPTQSKILALLLQHEGQAVSADQILERVLGAASESNVNVVKTHIRYLRAKLATLPCAASLIRTVPGVGYTAKRMLMPESGLA